MRKNASITRLRRQIRGAARALLGARPGKAGEAAGLAPYGTGEEFTNVAGTAGSVGE